MPHRAGRARVSAGAAAGLAALARPCGGAFEYDAAEKIESARLFGNLNKYAYYFTDLMVGEPVPQRASVIIDTGSRLVGFPCTDCGHCGEHLDPAFDISASDSATWSKCSVGCAKECVGDRCPYRETYAEGSSIEGFWFEDIIEFGDPFSKNPPVRAMLGCHSGEDKLFYTQRANGIMGLAPSTGIPSQPTILQQIFQDREHIDTRVFSICLATWGGRMTIGGYNTSYHLNTIHQEPIQWVAMTATQYYFVAPQGLVLIDGNDTVKVARDQSDFGVTIVDSGTTYTYFPDPAFSSLMARLGDYCEEHDGCGAVKESDRCWRLGEGAGPEGFPPLAVEFAEGVRIQWMPRQYLQQRHEDTLWCRTFMPNTMYQTVLGLSLMLHKDFIFDIGRGRLGIADAQCPEYYEQPENEGETFAEFTIAQKFKRQTLPPSPPRLGAPMSGVVQLATGGETEAGSTSPGNADGITAALPNPTLALPAFAIAVAGMAALHVVLCMARVNRRATAAPNRADQQQSHGHGPAWERLESEAAAGEVVA